MLTGFRTTFVHNASCPDVSPVHCADAEQNGEPIPAHDHDQTLLFGTLNSNVVYALQPDLQLIVNIPIQYRRTTISYSLLATGEPYEPPYAGIHHRNESLLGVGDPELAAQKFFSKNRYTLGVSLGSSVPLGKIEENPYLLALQGEQHQHLQLGTGVFMPNVTVTGIYTNQDHGLITQVRSEFSLYENQYEYYTGSAIRWDFGYWKRTNPRTVLLGQVRGSHEQPDEWMGLTAPHSERHSLGLAGVLTWKMTANTELIARFEQMVWLETFQSTIEHSDGNIPLHSILSIGAAIF